MLRAKRRRTRTHDENGNPIRNTMNGTPLTKTYKNKDNRADIKTESPNSNIGRRVPIAGYNKRLICLEDGSKELSKDNNTVYKDPYSKSCAENPNTCYTNTIKRIQNRNGYLNKKYNYSSKQYLDRRCRTFGKLEFNFASNVAINGSANSEFRTNCISDISNNCIAGNSIREGYSNCESKNNVCKAVYKRSNRKFSTQGAVSGGSRINRLKYQTLVKSQQRIAGDYNNMTNGVYPSSLYKDSHPTQKEMNEKNKSCPPPPPEPTNNHLIGNWISQSPVTIPIVFTGTVTVKWDENTSITYTGPRNSVTHDYGSDSGIKQITIIPNENQEVRIDYGDALELQTLANDYKDINISSDLESYIRAQLRDISQLGDNTALKSGSFKGCANLLTLHTNGDKQKLDSNISALFDGCTSLTNVLNMGNWDTGSVEFMDDLFKGASNLTNIESISLWNTAQLISMLNIFDGISNLDSSVLAWRSSGSKSIVGTWKAEQSLNNIVKIPCKFTGNVDIVWEDGVKKSYTSENQRQILEYQYSSSGNKSIKIKPSEEFSFDYNGDNAGLLLLEITQLGFLLKLIKGAFKGCRNLTRMLSNGASPKLDSDISNLFEDCVNLTTIEDIVNWNTENITKMEATFKNASQFNQNIASWNTSSVQTMNSMFSGATNFNQNIGTWNTSSVQTMNSMFSGATNFNNGGENAIKNWVISTVIDMAEMFKEATNFNQNIGTWNTSSVQTMNSMFKGASDFNNGGEDAIKNWVITNVADMAEMFKEATSFNQNIGNWNPTAPVSAPGSDTNISDILTGATSFEHDLTTVWTRLINESHTVTDNGNVVFSQTITNTNIDHAKKIVGEWEPDANNKITIPIVFDGSIIIKWGDNVNTTINSSTNQITSGSQNTTIEIFNGTNPTRITRFIQHTYSTNDLRNILIAPLDSVTTMEFKYGDTNNEPNSYPALNIRRNVKKIHQIGNQTRISRASFKDCDKVTYIKTNGASQILSNDLFGVFSMCSELTNIEGIENWDVSSVTAMRWTFQGCALFNQNINNWNTSNITTMANAFQDCSSFDKNLSSWNVSNVNNFSNTFSNATALLLKFPELQTAVDNSNVNANDWSSYWSSSTF